MKLCIPTETNEGLNSNVCGHFGSAPYFMIYDAETGTFEVITNTNMHHSHGMCQPLSLIGDKQIDAVVCQGMGMGAFQKLQTKGIKAYKANAKTVEQLVKDFNSKLLEEITFENTCAQHNCH
jgi:predicted Fe-Mo cluster-binding NifX family protein